MQSNYLFGAIFSIMQNVILSINSFVQDNNKLNAVYSKQKKTI